MTANGNPTVPVAASKDARGRWRAVVAVGLMVLLWLGVVLYRQEIRVRWWGYRLRHTTELADRMYYLRLLSGAGERAMPEAERLLGLDDASVRSFAVVLVNSCPGERATRLLERTCHDEDASVRQSAIVGLSMRPSDATVRHLRALADHPDADTAMLATNQLAAINGHGAAATLCDLARQHAHVAVRAQAIDALGQVESEAAIDTLIACLEDEAVFEGLTMSRRGALEALTRAAPGLAGDDAGDVVGMGESNGQRAARALRALTGQTFGCLEAPRENWSACVEAWRGWRESH
jgi:hypothetical protein